MVQEYKEGEPGPSTVALAQQKGIPIEEAVKRYEWQTPFSQAVSAVEEAMPDAYASSEITGHFTASVKFAGDVPAGAAEYFKAIPEHVDVELIGGAARALVPLRAEMEALFHKVNKDPGVEQALGWVDTDIGVIRIKVKLRVSTKSAQSDLRAKVAAYKADGSRTPVDLTFTDKSLGRT
ncbi:hypothetical protein GCM10028864_01260 [Microlunatus parietis]